MAKVPFPHVTIGDEPTITSLNEDLAAMEGCVNNQINRDKIQNIIYQAEQLRMNQELVIRKQTRMYMLHLESTFK